MKKNLLLFLIGATAFASTGELNLGFTPEFTVDSNNNLSSKYTLPYSFKVNFEEQGISFGAKDGKYNKDMSIGTIDLLSNDVNLWGQYDIKGDGTHSGALKVENAIVTSTNPTATGTVATTLSGTYKYTSDFLKYTGTLKYAGSRLVLSPKYFAFNNEVVVLGNYTINLNLKENFNASIPQFDKSGTLFSNFKSSGTGSVVTDLDLNAEIQVSDLTIKPGYVVNIYNGTDFVSTTDNDMTTLDKTNNSSYLNNTFTLNLEYKKDFDIVNLETELNNKLTFALVDGNIVKNSASATAQANQDYTVANYTLNPVVTVSKVFNLKPIDVKVTLGLEDSLVLGFGQKYNTTKYESAVTVSNTLNIKPGINFSTMIVEGLKLSTGVSFNAQIDNSSFTSFNTKFDAGLKYTW